MRIAALEPEWPSRACSIVTRLLPTSTFIEQSMNFVFFISHAAYFRLGTVFAISWCGKSSEAMNAQESIYCCINTMGTANVHPTVTLDTACLFAY